jgi:pimeloyl-ACP methyl ester carboxylesterase
MFANPMTTTAATSTNGLFYTVRGSGRPVVLIHGWCLSGRLWLYLEEDLATDHLVVCPDLAGFGRSELAGPYDLPRLAADVLSLVDDLALEAPVLVGFAFGAAVAMELAASSPGRVDGLVLIGVPSGETAPYDRMPKAMRRDWPDFARRSAAAICKQPQSEATLDWLERMFVSTPLPVAIETVGVLERFEPSALAPSLRDRSLFVHGRDDDVVPLAVAERCVAAAPDARLAIVEDSGHLVPYDQSSALAAIVRDFIGK